jgi:hypothetical protein
MHAVLSSNCHESLWTTTADVQELRVQAYRDRTYERQADMERVPPFTIGLGTQITSIHSASGATKKQMRTVFNNKTCCNVCRAYFACLFLLSEGSCNNAGAENAQPVVFANSDVTEIQLCYKSPELALTQSLPCVMPIHSIALTLPYTF